MRMNKIPKLILIGTAICSISPFFAKKLGAQEVMRQASDVRIEVVKTDERPYVLEGEFWEGKRICKKIMSSIQMLRVKFSSDTTNLPCREKNVWKRMEKRFANLDSLETLVRWVGEDIGNLEKIQEMIDTLKVRSIRVGTYETEEPQKYKDQKYIEIRYATILRQLDVIDHAFIYSAEGNPQDLANLE